MKGNEELFDGEILKSLGISLLKSITDEEKHDINLLIRPLMLGDFDKGYIALLGELTVISEVSEEQFSRRFFQMKSCPHTYFIIVMEDTDAGAVVGTASLIVEAKFIRGCALRGRIEDVVVSPKYRGFGIASSLIEVLVKLSDHLGCYKSSLECKAGLSKFYAKFGFVDEPMQMHLVRRI